MGTLRIKQDPTFDLNVKIPRQGRPDAEISVTYAFFDEKAFQALINEPAPADGVALDEVAEVMKIARGWGAHVTGEDDKPLPFNRDTVAQLCAQYRGAGKAICEAFLREYARVRLGN